MRSSRPSHVVLTVLVSAGCATGTLQTQEGVPSPPERQSNLLVGLRSFEDDGFGRLDDQIDFGLDYAERIGLEPVRLEGGLHYSFDTGNDALASGEGVELKAQTLELSAGFVAALSVGDLRPYAGLGASLLFVQLRGLDRPADEVFTDRDATLGGYLKLGLLLQVSPSAHVGLEYRHLEAGDVALGADDLDPAYDQLALVVGATF